MILVLILVLILVVLVVNEGLNELSDHYTLERNWGVVPNKYPNVKIIGAGISKSIVSFTTFHSNVLSHTDVVCLSDVGEYYNITECYNDNSVRKKKWIEIFKVQPVNNMFKIRGFDYKIFNMFDLHGTTSLDLAFQLLVNEIRLPYHIFKNNCHHSAYRVIEILSDMDITRRFSEHYDPNFFEFYKSNYRPLIYIKEFVSDLWTFKD